MAPRWGAAREEWAAAKRLAKVDLLPVVSNPHAEISPLSKMKSLGKTPSLYNGKRQVSGMRDWTEFETNVRNIEHWAEEPDYGVCIQTRRIRGLDIDVPDPKLAARIRAAFEAALGRDGLPCRYRDGTGKQLLAFVLEGDFDKRSFVVKEWVDETTGRRKRWLVEFLATGQQFIAAGTHPDGTRYEWEDGFPRTVPTITAKAFEEAWSELVEEFAIEEASARRVRAPTLVEDLEVDDPVAEHLINSDWPTYDEHKGMLYLECPWKENHSSDNGETETAWLLAGTGGYRNGHFACRHTGCSGHTDDDFFKAVGYRLTKPDDFEDLSTEAERAVEAYVALAPSALPKSKELKAEAKALANVKALPLPGFNRDNQGRIETTLENMRRALNAPQAAGCWIAYDEFRGELVYAEEPGQWQPMDDAYQVELRSRLHELGFKDEPAKEKMRDALEWVGKRNHIDTAITWLREVVPAWDGVSRIAGFFPRYFRTEDTPYTRACGDYLWTALAGRVLEPGLKADMVPVLVGEQGCRKSSGIRALSPAKEFFSEFSLDERDADNARKMRGCLVGELAELRGLQTKDRESILAWIARDTEEWTPKYKEAKIRLPRRCVFVASTNDDEFLSDPTGERRWLPNTVLGLVDVDAIVQDRLQLWAEARDVFDYEGLLHKRAERLAKLEHHKFKMVDHWEVQIAAWTDDPWGSLDHRGETPRSSGRLQTHDVIKQCLGLDPSKVSKRDQMRIAGILKRLGLVRVQRKVRGRNLKVWVEPKELRA